MLCRLDSCPKGCVVSHRNTFEHEHTRTINKHVPCGRGKRHDDPIQFARQFHLAPKPGPDFDSKVKIPRSEEVYPGGDENARVGEPERHIQHIVLVVLRLREQVIVLWGQDDVACRTCH